MHRNRINVPDATESRRTGAHTHTHTSANQLGYENKLRVLRLVFVKINRNPRNLTQNFSFQIIYSIFFPSDTTRLYIHKNVITGLLVSVSQHHLSGPPVLRTLLVYSCYMLKLKLLLNVNAHVF